MKPTEQIANLKKSLLELFGEDDAVIRAIELKEKYLKIATSFERLRNQDVKYEDALQQVKEEFFVSESTIKTALRFHDSLVNNF